MKNIIFLSAYPIITFLMSDQTAIKDLILGFLLIMAFFIVLTWTIFICG
jgi:hypothetical protein